MRTHIYAATEFADRPLRTKTFDPMDLPAFDDPDWVGEALSPNVVRITVSGADAGDWIIAPTPVANALYPDGTAVETPDALEFTAVAETDDVIEDELRALVVTAIGTALVPGPLYRWYSAVIEDPADNASMLLTVRPDAPYHALVLTPGGTGALAASPDDIYPITWISSNNRSAHGAARTEVYASIVPVDDAGVPVPNDTGCTMTVALVRTVERHERYEAVNAEPLAHVSKSSVPEALFDIDGVLTVPLDGGQVTVRMTDLVDPPTDCVAFEVHTRPVQA